VAQTAAFAAACGVGRDELRGRRPDPPRSGGRRTRRSV